ncbi:MAG: hypothetical protein LUE27_01835 [Clostridia bacterium]|nr:hypothetical protein [Clostridia bacterium]
MSKIPEHEIHVTPNKKGKGYLYEIDFENELGKFYAVANDAESCEKAFRKQYRHELKKAMREYEGTDEEPEAGGEPEASPSDPDAVYRMQSSKSKIRVELNQDNLPRDLGSLADLFFDVVYKQDPDMPQEELAKNRDLFNLLVVSANEDRSMTYLDSHDIKDTCKTLVEDDNSEVAEMIEQIVVKMKSLASGIYSIRRDIQNDMREKYDIMTDEEIGELLSGTAGTKFQLMFAVPLFIGIDISQRRQIRIHKGYVSTTTDMDERDEMNMNHYTMTDNLDGFITKNTDRKLGKYRDNDGKISDHAIALTIGDPSQLEDILTEHCPGHTLKDLYATFWVRGLD